MIGTQIRNYRIVEKLGEGGMGVVYKGTDVLLERSVAVKVLSSELTRNPELVERFRAEAKAQANLNHPNLATLYAVLVEGEKAFMVMAALSVTSSRQRRRSRWQSSVPMDIRWKTRGTCVPIVKKPAIKG